MSEERKPFDDLLFSVRQIRDELAVQMNLAKAEAKEEWGRLEGKLKQLESAAVEPVSDVIDDLKEKAEPIAGAIDATAQNVGSALELAAEELKKGYDRLRGML